jgi:hypothetical protein
VDVKIEKRKNFHRETQWRDAVPHRRKNPVIDLCVSLWASPGFLHATKKWTGKKKQLTIRISFFLYLLNCTCGKIIN